MRSQDDVDRTATTGVRLGVDVGAVRVGVAVSDPDGILATPVVTLARDAEGGTDLEQLVELVRAHAAVEVVVGLPIGLSGREGAAATTARDYARDLARRLGTVTVRLVDERLSTVHAQRALRDSGRDERRHRPVVDQAAAVVILQHVLDADRSSPSRIGQVVRTGRRKPRRKD